MPKKDMFGKIDTFVDLVVVGGDDSTWAVKPAASSQLESGSAARTSVIKSHYHPDWHHPSDLGNVEWHCLAVASPFPENCRVVGVVQDYDTASCNDVVGTVEVPVPGPGYESEGWFPVMESAGKQVQG